jgi:hypothetical protein
MTVRRVLVPAGIVLGFAAGFVARGAVAVTPAADAQAADRVYELRARFRDHTLRLVAKHGVSNVADLTRTEGPLVGNTLIYMLTHQSRAAADTFWKNFQGDPDWIKARDASVADGPITTGVTRVWLKPTDWSQVR